MLSGRCRWLASGVRAAVFFQNPIPRASIIWWRRVLLLCCLGVPLPSKRGLGADAVSPIREGESSRESGGRLQALGEAKPTEGHLLLHPHLGGSELGWTFWGRLWGGGHPLLTNRGAAGGGRARFF